MYFDMKKFFFIHYFLSNILRGVVSYAIWYENKIGRKIKFEKKNSKKRVFLYVLPIVRLEYHH